MPRHAHPSASAHRRAFTLIELLTVIAIIGILAAIIIPTVGAVRKTAKRVQCSSNVRQLGTAFLLFANEQGRLPKSGIIAPFGNWDLDLRPYLGMTRPYEGWTAEAGVRDYGAEMNYQMFRCPVDETPRQGGGFTQSYSMPGWICNSAGAYGNLGATWAANTGAPNGAIQNPSRTLLLVENLQAAREAGRRVGEWANSLSDTPDPDISRWVHDGRTIVLFADGHVETLSPSSLASGLVAGGQINGTAWAEYYGRMR